MTFRRPDHASHQQGGTNCPEHTTGGFGIIVLLTLTSVAMIAFFARYRHHETLWQRLIAPALAAILLGGIAVLAVRHYAVLLGVPSGDPAAWALPACFYGLPAVIGLAWALTLKIRRPDVYATIGLGCPGASRWAPSSPPRGSRAL